MKKSYKLISGQKLFALIDEKVTKLGDFAENIGVTPQGIREWRKKMDNDDRLKIEEKTVEKLKYNLNVTYDDIKYVPRETESKADANQSSVQSHPLYVSLKRELDEVRQSRDDWKERAREYKADLDRLRGQ